MSPTSKVTSPLTIKEEESKADMSESKTSESVTSKLPPTALTVSFSNTVHLNKPRAEILPTSIKSELILKPEPIVPET